MDKEHQAIDRLIRASEMSIAKYGKPLIVTTSGGKDSSVCVELALRAGIPFEVMHNHTTADAPETVRFVRSEFRRLGDMGIRCILNMPVYKGKQTSMWNLIPQKLMPPTRRVRYCCEVLKEHGGDGRFIATGVRWAESSSRKNGRGTFEIQNKNPEKRVILRDDNDPKRRLFETCQIKGKRTCNPIVDWEDDDVWSFLAESRCPVNPLYEKGCSRVGCIGCPLAGVHKRELEFLMWPEYKRLYIRTFEKMLYERDKHGKNDLWSSGEDVYQWWMEYDTLPGQIDILEDTHDKI